MRQIEGEGRIRGRDRIKLQRILTTNSNPDHFEVFFPAAAVGAGPVHGHVFPAGAGRDAVFWPAFGFVVNKAAKQAHPGFVFGAVAHGGGSGNWDRIELKF